MLEAKLIATIEYGAGFGVDSAVGPDYGNVGSKYFRFERGLIAATCVNSVRFNERMDIDHHAKFSGEGEKWEIGKRCLEDVGDLRARRNRQALGLVDESSQEMQFFRKYLCLCSLP